MSDRSNPSEAPHFLNPLDELRESEVRFNGGILDDDFYSVASSVASSREFDEASTMTIFNPTIGYNIEKFLQELGLSELALRFADEGIKDTDVFVGTPESEIRDFLSNRLRLSTTEVDKVIGGLLNIAPSRDMNEKEDNALSTIEKRLRRLQRATEQCIRDLEKVKTSFDSEEIAQQTRDLIEAQFEDLHTSLDERKTELLKQVSDTVEKHRQRLDLVVTKLSTERKQHSDKIHRYEMRLFSVRNAGTLSERDRKHHTLIDLQREFDILQTLVANAQIITTFHGAVACGFVPQVMQMAKDCGELGFRPPPANITHFAARSRRCQIWIETFQDVDDWYETHIMDVGLPRSQREVTFGNEYPRQSSQHKDGFGLSISRQSSNVSSGYQSQPPFRRNGSLGSTTASTMSHRRKRKYVEDVKKIRVKFLPVSERSFRAFGSAHASGTGMKELFKRYNEDEGEWFEQDLPPLKSSQSRKRFFQCPIEGLDEGSAYIAFVQYASRFGWSPPSKKIVFKTNPYDTTAWETKFSQTSCHEFCRVFHPEKNKDEEHLQVGTESAAKNRPEEEDEKRASTVTSYAMLDCEFAALEGSCLGERALPDRGSVSFNVHFEDVSENRTDESIGTFFVVGITNERLNPSEDADEKEQDFAARIRESAVRMHGIGSNDNKSENGRLFVGHEFPIDWTEGEGFGHGDTVRVVVDFDAYTLKFYKNNKLLGDVVVNELLDMSGRGRGSPRKPIPLSRNFSSISGQSGSSGRSESQSSESASDWLAHTYESSTHHSIPVDIVPENEDEDQWRQKNMWYPVVTLGRAKVRCELSFDDCNYSYFPHFLAQ